MSQIERSIRIEGPVAVLLLLAALMVPGSPASGEEASREGGQPSQGKVLVVAEDGSGDYRTIGEAMLAATQGDVIHVKAGVYREEVTLKSGIVLRGEGREKVRVEAGRAVLLSLGQENVDVRGITLVSEGEKGIGLGVVDSKRITMADCRIIASGGLGVGVEDSAGVLIRGCEVTGAKRGIIIFGNAEVLIRGNLIRGNEQGVSLRHRGQAKIVGNTIVENMGGIVLYESSAAEVYDNIIAFNRFGGVAVDRGADVQLGYNDVYRNGEALDLNYLRLDPVSPAPHLRPGTDLSLDPLFVSPSTGDYRLRPDSPLIGKGREGSSIGAFPPQPMAEVYQQSRPSRVARYDPVKDRIVINEGLKDATEVFGAAVLVYALQQMKDMKAEAEFTLEDEYRALTIEMRFWEEAGAPREKDFQDILTMMYASFQKGPTQFFRDLWLRTPVFLFVKGGRGDQFQQLRESHVNYTFEYPTGWRAEHFNEHPSSIFIRGPLNLDRTFHVAITVDAYPKGDSEYASAEQFIRVFMQSGGVKQNRPSRITPITVGGQQARMFTISYLDHLPWNHLNAKETPIKEAFVVIEQEDGFYVLAYAAPDELYKTRLPAFQHMLDTFRFQEPGAPVETSPPELMTRSPRREELPDVEPGVVDLLIQGERLGRARRLREAQEVFERVLQLTQDPVARSVALLGLGRIFTDQGKLEQAQEKYEEVLMLTQAAEDFHELRAIAFNGLGLIFFNLGELAKAQAALEEALTLTRVPDRRARVLNSLGEVFHVQGHLEKARATYEEGLRSVQDDRELIAPLHVGLGRIFYDQGRWEEAQKAFEDAIRLAIDDEALSAAYSNLGIIFHDLGWLGEATEKYQKAISLTRNPDRKSTYLHNLGDVLLEQEKFGEALKVYEEALTLTSNPNKKAATLNSISGVFISLGRLEKAREVLERALMLSSDLTLRPTLLSNLGGTLSDLGHLEMALATYQEALASVTDGFPPPEATSPYPNPRLSEIRFRERAIGILAGKGRTLWRLADRTSQVEQKLAFLRMASEALALSVDLTETIRGSFQQEKAKIGFLQERFRAYEAMTHVLLALDQVGDNPPDPSLRRFGRTYREIAFHYAERAKARVLLELLAAARLSAAKGLLPLEVAAQEAELEREVLARQKTLEQVATTPGVPPARLADARAELTRAEEALEAFVARLRQGPPSYRAYAALKYPQPPAIPDLPLKPDEVLLEFQVTEAATYLWVLRKDHPLRFFSLPGRHALQPQVEAFLAPFQASSPALGAFDPVQAHALYRRLKLNEALAGLPQGTRVVIVPDDLLFRLPFELLVTDVGELRREYTAGIPFYPGVRYLGQDWVVSYYASAGTLVVNRQERRGEQAWPFPLLAVGDPQYPGDGGGTGAGQRAASARLSLVRAATAQGYVFEPLPATREEVLAIAKVLEIPADSPDLLLGARATKARLLQRNLAQYRFLHLATHGLLGAEVPGLQQPALVLGDEGGDEQQMVLTMEEVFDLKGKVNAELVVLSACQTGRGKEIRGEGVIGLTRAFLYAGTPSVVVSLWSVNDESTARFMARFYHYVVNEKQDKAAALQKARLDLLNGYIDSETGATVRYPHPFFWAPFILVGER